MKPRHDPRLFRKQCLVPQEELVHRLLLRLLRLIAYGLAHLPASFSSVTLLVQPVAAAALA